LGQFYDVGQFFGKRIEENSLGLRRNVMKPVKYLVLSVLVLSLFSWSCASAPKKEAAAAKPAQPAPAGAFLADMHAKKQVNCDACHGTGGTAVDDNEQPVNMNCVKCHGALAEVAKKATGHINPHKSHLGEISCTACHSGHAASKPYCLNCHDFVMKISSGEGPAQPAAAP
jgi:fumarate reductase flavoprotein subunit